jgi:spore germination protein YaaH
LVFALGGGWLLLRIRGQADLVSPLSTSFSIFSVFEQDTDPPSHTIYGYLPYWGLGKIKYLQLDKLTDIAYFGLYLNADGTFKQTLEDGTTEPGYAGWRSNKDLEKLILESKKSGVRVSLTVISHADEISDEFLNCASCWAAFVENLETELNYHHIKNVNLNFEYVEPVSLAVASKYTKFVAYTNSRLDALYEDSYLVVSTFADSFIRSRVTDVEELSKVSDALFIMGYDFHRPTSDTAGPVAPVGGADVHAEYDITTMLADYLASSPPNKLILGVPYYGYNWVVEKNSSYAKRIEGTDDIGFSQSQIYADIMADVAELAPTVLWDDLGQVPYFTYVSPSTGSTRQVYFENKESLRIKYSLAKEYGLAGVGIWALGYDGARQELWDLLAEEF